MGGSVSRPTGATHGGGVSSSAESACPMGYGTADGARKKADGEGGKEGAGEDATERLSAVSTTAAEESGGEGGGGCPVGYRKMGTKGREVIYDVYGQEVDRRNLMPAKGNELPSPGQAERLSVERERSTIPKGGSDETWTYPSPQQFYNALKRKGKGDDVVESDVDVVVQIHNQMNEKTWKEVLRWENKLHCDCDDVKLLRFEGKPHQLSPSARLRTWTGAEPPFDRHDWMVDRCGEEVRYVIDYYYRDPESAPDADRIQIHVRPALDSFQAAFDRAKMRFMSAAPSMPPRQTMSDSTGATLEKTLPDGIIEDEEFQNLSSLTGLRIREISNAVGKNCSGLMQTMQSCNLQTADGQPSVECEQASVAANFCAATTICPKQADQFMKSMSAGDADIADRYEQMTGCLDRFHLMARRVLAQERGSVQLGPEGQYGTPQTDPSTSPAPAATPS